jgi:hypothetical protein
MRLLDYSFQQLRRDDPPRRPLAWKVAMLGEAFPLNALDIDENHLEIIVSKL